MTTDQLLLRTEFLLKVREQGHINGRVLTYAGYDWLDGELMAIDNELDREKPEGKFVDLIESVSTPFGWKYEVVGFEPVNPASSEDIEWMSDKLNDGEYELDELIRSF